MHGTIGRKNSTIKGYGNDNARFVAIGCFRMKCNNMETKSFDTNTLAVCPYCGKKMDMATAVKHDMEMAKPPKPGNVTVCIECLNVAMFDEDLTLVKMDPETWAEFRRDPVAVAYVEFYRFVVRKLRDK